jgi:aarF domain-containing kinase
MKSSFTSRSLKLLSLASKVGRKELTQSIKEQFVKGVDEITSGRMKTRIDQARLITEHLSQLKGAAMKAGQLLSLDAQDYFPPEAVELLSKLQGQAEPVSWDILEKTLLEELGPEKAAELKNLSQTPAASASIGQVHRANLSGHEVAIKIQYPGIADSIDSDLSILRTLAQSFISLTGRKMDLTELFEELALVLKQEANYSLELENMSEFRRLLASDSDYIVPHAFNSHSSRRVLTMSWEAGLNINEWLKTNPTYIEREKVAKLVLDLYCREFFEWGMVQTDPNYGNFLIQDNPLRLVVLDFGAVLKYTPQFRHDYVELIKSLGTLDRQKIIRSFQEFGAIDPRESQETLDLFSELLLLSFEPFQSSRQPFRFRDNDFAIRSRDVGQRFTQSLRYSAPPRKILFLHRKLGGVFTLLKKLDVQLDLVPYWQKMTETVISTT